MPSLCDAEVFEVGRGAVSRVTRDDGAEVEICPRCGEREALREAELPGAGAWPPLVDWPLSIEDLLDEERALLELRRRSKLDVVTIDPETADRMLREVENEPFGHGSGTEGDG
jgi:hypothetical protein